MIQTKPRENTPAINTTATIPNAAIAMVQNACAMLRKAARLREKSMTPVIFLTSKDDELDEALGLAMGADDYISNPSRNAC